MNKEEIEHLASLSRIKLDENEKTSLEKDLSSIVSYVGVISDLVADDVEAEPKVGAQYNVFRADEVTNEPEQYTADIMAEMPEVEGRFLKVKKIIQTD